jgi:hypothetical protein
MKNTLRTLALATALGGALSTSAAAQIDVTAPRSNTAGFNLGAFVNAAGIQVEDSDAENGVGLGLHLGYGFSQNVSIFARVNVTSIGSDELADNYNLAHVDLGARYSFGQPSATLRPYLAGALSGHAVSFDLGSSGTLDARGPGLTASGGLEYFLSRTVALEAGLSVSVGKFNEGRIGDSGWVDLDEDELNTTTSRLDIGVSWHP